MFGALLYMAQRPGYQENWSGNNWIALKCAVEENGEHKMNRESN